MSYDRILRLERPNDTYFVGYADDVATVIVARDNSKPNLNST